MKELSSKVLLIATCVLVMVFIGFHHCKNCSQVVNGIDTTMYKIYAVSEQNIILRKKSNTDFFSNNQLSQKK